MLVDVFKNFRKHGDLSFLAERKKIKKCNELVCNIHNKENYVIHIRALKQVLNHGLIPKRYIETFNLIISMVKTIY